jgi:hypothetical protein
MRVLLSLIVAAGCSSNSSGPPPPSCQQAFTHYYAAGCAYHDVNGNPITADQMTQACLQDAANTPARCKDELNSFLFCNDEVPTPSTTNADCDCSQEQQAFVTCN